MLLCRPYRQTICLETSGFASDYSMVDWDGLDTWNIKAFIGVGAGRAGDRSLPLLNPLCIIPVLFRLNCVQNYSVMLNFSSFPFYND